MNCKNQLLPRARRLLMNHPHGEHPKPDKTAIVLEEKLRKWDGLIENEGMKISWHIKPTVC